MATTEATVAATVPTAATTVHGSEVACIMFSVAPTVPLVVDCASRPFDRHTPQEVDGMPKVVLTHAVIDVQRWLTGKDERVADIGAVGTNVTDYVAADGSNN